MHLFYHKIANDIHDIHGPLATTWISNWDQLIKLIRRGKTSVQLDFYLQVEQFPPAGY